MRRAYPELDLDREYAPIHFKSRKANATVGGPPEKNIVFN